MISPGTPKKPLLLLKLFIDQGLQLLAGKGINFKGSSYLARVLEWATIDRSIPYPPGPVQISDAKLSLADVDNTVRDWFNTTTPIGRQAQIIFEDENQPLGTLVDPIYSGEVSNSELVFPTGKVEMVIKDAIQTFLDRPLPNLLIRDNFPNLPDNVDLGFIPIIFGSCQSFSESGVEPQGVIKCWECDTTLHRFVVARHLVSSVDVVYRKLPRVNSLFKVVSPTEYTIVFDNPPRIINGVPYQMTFIQFNVAQPTGTEIHADVSGINYRYDFNSNSVQSGTLVRNPVDAIVDLLFFLLEDVITSGKFDSQSFIDTRQRCIDKTYFCDGAITEQVTASVAISRLASDFGIDFFQTSHGLIKVHQYDPELDLNNTVLINERFIGRQTFTPALNSEIYNRFRFRYFHQNALLTEFVKSSVTGQWGREDIYDYIPDQSELGATGENSILELELELHFIRDTNVAKNVVKRRIGYYTLRSYTAQFDLPLPEFVNLDLTQLISLSHFAGVSKTGWTDKILKVFRLTQNLKTWRLTTEAVFIAPISDADLSYNGGAPAHDPQILYPQLALLVGDGKTYLDYPNGDPQAILSDTYPAPPTTGSDDEGTIPSSFNFTSTGSGTKSLPSNKVSFTNVRFQEDRTTSPRSISAYVAIPSLASTVQFVTGTLSPDTRPTGLTTADIYKVIFYATDFDHFYWYVGTGEAGSPSGWLVIDECDGQVEWRIYAPSRPSAWHLCDGSANVLKSDYKGDTSVIQVPNLIGAYPKGSSTYTGPSQTPAVDSTINDPGHIHPVTVSGITLNSGPHSHFPSVVVTDTGHSHGLSGTETDRADVAHDHGYGTGHDDGSITTASYSASQGGEGGGQVVVAGIGDFIGTGGRTLDTEYPPGSGQFDSTHSHRFTGQETDAANVASSLSVSVNFTGSDGVHAHFIQSFGSTAPSTTNITVTSGEPAHVGLLPYMRL